MGLVIGLIIAAATLVSWRWVKGIDYMIKNHPDYKGEDFLDWGEDDVTKTAGRDGWNDDAIHTEQDFM